ncbi:UNVERIFIED_CONTAM: Peroxidase 11 [Sesamum latifolium]|uniref:peroxidase n=1 Tax=Sesamum latifolium TaxID=2727402 RepID=A0AAW2YCZ9_9LAMI
MASSLHSKGLILHCLILALSIVFSTLHASEPPLTLDYYKSTCPTVLEIVRKEMECAVLSDPRNAALILRSVDYYFLQRGHSLQTNLPTADEGLLSIISKFLYQGLSVTDMVALSGAHTIGMARCVNFRNRIYGDFVATSGFNNPLSQQYLSNLKSVCPPVKGSDNNESAMDYVSPNLFDNSYYQILLRGEGLINSDQELYSSILAIETKKLVAKYAENPIAFFEQFSESMVKMGNITNPDTYVDGEVRKNCRFVNT